MTNPLSEVKTEGPVLIMRYFVLIVCVEDLLIVLSRGIQCDSHHVTMVMW